MVGTKEDFKIYDEQYFLGQSEVLQQYTDVFNAGSNGAIQLVTNSIKGDFEHQSFIKKVTGGTVSHRDITSTSAITAAKMEQDEMIAPKVNRRIGPNSNTLDQWKKINEDPRMFSYFYGRQTAEDMTADWLNTSVLAAVACFEAEDSNMVYNATGLSDKELRTEYLVRGLKLLGDRAQRIRAWVMHSHAFYELVEGQILDKVTNVADVVIYGGVPGSLGRPIIVTDSPALVDEQTTGNDHYYTLGLTDSAIVCTQSEDQNVVSQIEVGKENLIMTIQGEFAYNARVKGFSFGGSTPNPDDSVLGDPLNWEFMYHDVKMGPGVAIKTE